MSEYPAWMVPGAFVIAQTSSWRRPDGRVTGRNPIKGKIYTLAGLGSTRNGLMFVLAEFPNAGFDADNFKPSPAYLEAIFRLWRDNPHYEIPTLREITINGKVH